MKFDLSSLKIFQPLLKARNLYIILVIITIVFFGFLTQFLYLYLYQTITQSERIILLKNEVAPDFIDINEVNSVVAFMEKKSAVNNTDWSKIKNPFALLPVSPLALPGDTATTMTE